MAHSTRPMRCDAIARCCGMNNCVLGVHEEKQREVTVEGHMVVARLGDSELTAG